MTTIHMDCVQGMRTMIADNTIDAIVTDPPYELGFMGRAWDASGIAYSVEMWREALRVLKPGGHLLAFSGSRTYHRMVCAIEDAGFEIRDQIMWVYGSGFPKSLDVSKAIDKAAGAERTEVIGKSARHNSRSFGAGEGDADYGTFAGGVPDVLAPATEAARQWQGWGTALKPAHEPIVVARKPLIGTVAANVLAHGTGAINVDGCRVKLGAGEQPYSYPNGRGGEGWHGRESLGSNLDIPAFGNDAGRWPANLMHDGSDEVLAAFPQTESHGGGSAARFFYCAKASKTDRGEGNTHPTVKPTDLMRYLCRLVTPPGGVILDPFSGSGSTGKAATLEGFGFLGFDMHAEHVEIANRRKTDK